MEKSLKYNLQSKSKAEFTEQELSINRTKQSMNFGGSVFCR